MLLTSITHAEMLIRYATYVQQIGLLYITLICANLIALISKFLYVKSVLCSESRLCADMLIRL